MSAGSGHATVDGDTEDDVHLGIFRWLATVIETTASVRGVRLSKEAFPSAAVGPLRGCEGHISNWPSHREICRDRKFAGNCRATILGASGNLSAVGRVPPGRRNSARRARGRRPRETGRRPARWPPNRARRQHSIDFGNHQSRDAVDSGQAGDAVDDDSRGGGPAGFCGGCVPGREEDPLARQTTDSAVV